MKLVRGWCINGPTGDIGEEASTEEDGEGSEVLGRVVDGDVLESRAERVLNVRAESVWENHFKECLRL